MAKRRLKCSKCDRTFSLSAHLARHLQATHGLPRGKATASRTPKRRSPSVRRYARRASPGGTATYGDSGIVGQMQEYRQGLLVQRGALDAQIDAIARALEVLGAAPASGGGRSGPKRGRPRGSGSGSVRKRGRPPGGGSRSAPTRGRPPGGGSEPAPLKVSILKVLRQRAKPMSPAQIAAELERNGYKSKAKDFAKSVSNRLSELKEVHRVGVGMYSA